MKEKKRISAISAFLIKISAISAFYFPLCFSHKPWYIFIMLSKYRKMK